MVIKVPLALMNRAREWRNLLVGYVKCYLPCCKETKDGHVFLTAVQIQKHCEFTCLGAFGCGSSEHTAAVSVEANI